MTALQFCMLEVRVHVLILRISRVIEVMSKFHIAYKDVHYDLNLKNLPPSMFDIRDERLITKSNLPAVPPALASR